MKKKKKGRGGVGGKRIKWLEGEKGGGGTWVYEKSKNMHKRWKGDNTFSQFISLHLAASFLSK